MTQSTSNICQIYDVSICIEPAYKEESPEWIDISYMDDLDYLKEEIAFFVREKFGDSDIPIRISGSENIPGDLIHYNMDDLDWEYLVLYLQCLNAKSLPFAMAFFKIAEEDWYDQWDEVHYFHYDGNKDPYLMYFYHLMDLYNIDMHSFPMSDVISYINYHQWFFNSDYCIMVSHSIANVRGRHHFFFDTSAL